MDHLDRKARREIVGDAARAVRGVVVDDDQIAVEAARPIRVEDGPDEFGKTIALVVRRRDQRQRGSGGDARGQNP
jgi:hypothetical protein